MSLIPQKLSMQIVFSTEMQILSIQFFGLGNPKSINAHPKHRDSCFYEFLCCLAIADGHAGDEQIKNQAAIALRGQDHSERWKRLTRPSGGQSLLSALRLDSKAGDSIWQNNQAWSVSQHEYKLLRKSAWRVFLEYNYENEQIELRNAPWLATVPIEICISTDSFTRSATSQELIKLINRLQLSGESQSPRQFVAKNDEMRVISNFKNKGYEKLANEIENISNRKTSAGTAVLIQYSGLNAGGVILTLLELGSRVDLYIVNPMTCSDKAQIRRIRDTFLGTNLEEWQRRKYLNCARNLRIYGYPQEFASLKALLVHNQLVATSMYLHYPDYEGSKIEGQLPPLTIASAPSNNYTTLSEFVEGWVAMLRKPSTESGYEGVVELFDGNKLSGILEG